MMLLLVRLISFPLLLPRPLVKTSFSLLRPWRFLILVLMGRFVRRRGGAEVTIRTGSTLERRERLALETQHCVVVQPARATAPQVQRSRF
nr:hypothetical protein [Anaplasma phagocytophilum]